MMRALITLAVTLSAACAAAQTSAPQPKTVDEAREQAKGRKSAPPTAEEQVAVLGPRRQGRGGARRAAEGLRAQPRRLGGAADW
jgi:hypothetical protein